MIYFFLLSVFFSTSIEKIYAAPCCSGAGLLPSLITTDSRAQLSTRVSQSSVIGNSDHDGSSIFFRDENDEYTSLLSLNAAYALHPRWQVHAEVPVSFRYRAIDERASTGQGLGDVSFGGAFEAIQELKYSQVLPRTWVFLDATFPTGKSVDKSQDLLKADVHGRGQWALTAGAFSVKSYRVFSHTIDHYFLAEYRNYFSKNAFQHSGSLTLFDFGTGYNISDYRVGLSIGPIMEFSRDRFSQSTKLVWNVGAQLSKVIAELWTVLLNYSDQTLLGPTFNSSLSRTLALSVVRRFE